MARVQARLSSQSGITLRMETSISSHEAPEMSVRPTLPGRIRSPTIWSRPTTNVTEPGECPGVCKHPIASLPGQCEVLSVLQRLVVPDARPFGVGRVHVDRGVRLAAHRVQRVHVVRVAVRDQDRHYRRA